jgi:hypothetical protein
VLTSDQISDYERDGFLVLRGRFGDAEISRMESALERNPPLDGTLDAPKRYPEPGRYTLANNCPKDPDLAFLAEHPAVTGPAGELLGDEPRLTAFVIYDRTPGGPGIPSHNDYKRWRPVGSSMNWLFTIVPFCDFDGSAGQLFVSPGSHRLERIRPGRERPLEVGPAIRPDESSYVDPELRRGDLLLMNMHLWHQASGNTSDHSRVGAFNKYAAASAPPATGYFLYDDDVHRALSPEGQRLLAVHSDKPVGTTRVVLLRQRNDATEVLMMRDESGQWHLPGGEAVVERAIPDWDHGNYIAAAQQHLRSQLRIETPWLTYVGDYDEGDHLCRVYAYTLSGLGFPVPYDEGEWRDTERLVGDPADLAFGYEPDAVAAWLDPAPVRGKGLTQAASRIDQYAY